MSSAPPDPTGNKPEQPMLAEPMYPNRARAQPLLPLTNTSSMAPGKQNRKKRIVKIVAVDDCDEIPLVELNHSMDGLTVPTHPSVGANVTDGNAEESKLEQHKERRREENHKQNHPTIITNSNTPPSTEDGVVSSALSQLPLSTAGRPPPIITSNKSIMKGSSKGANSTPNTPTHHPEFPLLTKSLKGVSFPHEDKHHPQADLSSLASKEQLSSESHSTALHATTAQKEGVSTEVCH